MARTTRSRLTEVRVRTATADDTKQVGPPPESLSTLRRNPHSIAYTLIETAKMNGLDPQA